MDNSLSFPDIFDNQHTRATGCCEYVSENKKEMPWGFDSKTLKV
jgi:hypothetical protein